MFKIILKHIIYEMCLDTLFRGIYTNFVLPEKLHSIIITLDPEIEDLMDGDGDFFVDIMTALRKDKTIDMNTVSAIKIKHIPGDKPND